MELFEVFGWTCVGLSCVILLVALVIFAVGFVLTLFELVKRTLRAKHGEGADAAREDHEEPADR